MSKLEAAGIHCTACECVRSYTGTTVVGDTRCENCGHQLRKHNVDTQAFYVDAQGNLPPDVSIGAYFE